MILFKIYFPFSLDFYLYPNQTHEVKKVWGQVDSIMYMWF